MKKPKVVYHGSDKEIVGYLQPRKASDESLAENNLEAVYATDRFECAAGMSLTGDKWAYADYAEKDFQVIFVEEPPTSNTMRYVYELDADSFNEIPKGSHQWISQEKVAIVKTHIFKTEELSAYWRMATEEEKEEQYRLYGYEE